MCGIFGWLGAAPADPAKLVATVGGLLHHRGPDDHGSERGPGWGLGFARLAILDLSPTGHQPMGTPDGRYWLAFNGEIYNYLELRAQLEAAGERFAGTSDTEVLLRLLARSGAAALERLNGMFALALVDTVARSFLLARDRLGVKPLYYHAQRGQVRFGSELKALLAWPAAPRALDPAALADYLALGYVPAERCILQGYAKLTPGSYLAGSLDAPEAAAPRRYWALSLNAERGGAPLTPAQLDDLAALLTDAVRLRLRSDVPLGVFLSGGIDSGLVAHLAGQAAGSRRPLALTVSFDDEAYDEAVLAQAAAQHAGLEHRLVRQAAGGLAGVDRLAWFFDEPFGDSSALPTLALCEAAADHATVYLSGDGGDEAFGGYQRYLTARRLAGWSPLLAATAGLSRGAAQLWPPLTRMRHRLLKLGRPDQGFAAVVDDSPDDPGVRQVLSPALRPHLAASSQRLAQRWAAAPGPDLTARQQALDYGLYLPDDILVKMDRASMAHALEVRSPFLDYRVVEWAARLPRRALLAGETGKRPLRALADRWLPPAVSQGRKRGFGVPLDRWFAQPAGQALVRARLLAPEAQARGLWSAPGVEQVLAQAGVPGRRKWGWLLWRLLVLDAWARQYHDSATFLSGPPTAPAPA